MKSFKEKSKPFLWFSIEKIRKKFFNSVIDCKQRNEYFLLAHPQRCFLDRWIFEQARLPLLFSLNQDKTFIVSVEIETSIAMKNNERTITQNERKRRRSFLYSLVIRKFYFLIVVSSSINKERGVKFSFNQFCITTIDRQIWNKTKNII